MPNHQPRLEFIDALRGIAILGVLLTHYVPAMSHIYQLVHPDLLAYSTNGKYGVHLFFIISGYVIFMTLDKDPKLLNFAFARFSRLYPPFWIAVTISFILISNFGHPLRSYTPNWSDYVLNMTMLQRFFLVKSIDGSYWSLTFELMFYFYMGITIITSTRNRVNLYIVIWLILSIAFTALAYYNEIHITDRWKGLFLIEFNSFFFTGVILYQYRKQKRLDLFLVVFFLSAVQQYLIAGLKMMFVYLSATLIFIAFTQLKSLSANWLVYTGRISYSLYLIQAVPGYVLMAQLQRLGYSPLTTISIVLISVFITAYFLRLIFEIKVQQKLRQWWFSF